MRATDTFRLATQIATVLMAKEESNEKRTPISLRIPADLDAMLNAAHAATGTSKTELILDCLRRCIKEVVQERFDKREQAELEWRGIEAGTAVPVTPVPAPKPKESH